MIKDKLYDKLFENKLKLFIFSTDTYDYDEDMSICVIANNAIEAYNLILEKL